MSKYVWLIRHAENEREANAEGNLPLSPEGKRQFLRLSDLIASSSHIAGPAAIIYANILRGEQSAAILSERFNAAGLAHSLSAQSELASEETEEMAQLLLKIYGSDAPPENDAPAPQTLIFILHRRNELMNMLSVLIDPNAHMKGNHVDIEQLKASRDAGTEDVAALFGLEDSIPVESFNYGEAIAFRLNVERWSDFDIGCGQRCEHIQAGLD